MGEDGDSTLTEEDIRAALDYGAALNAALQIWSRHPILDVGCYSQELLRGMPKQGQHVVPRGGKWRVQRAGAARASGVYQTQQEAIAKGREIARNQGTELYIHGRDGRIRERDSYGRDPHPPKG